MSYSGIAHRTRILALAALTLCVWLILGMVYADRFFPPFGRLEMLLMPWKERLLLHVGLDQRLALMQQQLDAAGRVSSAALAALVVSFAALSVYLSVVHQQNQQRVRENLVLGLKNREIARRNEFIRYISATIGHEFKNNLGRIKRRIDLLPALAPEVKARIDDNLEKLFADIEIFKKIADEREAGLVEFETIDFRSLLDELAVQYGDLAEIEIRACESLPTIYAAPQLLKSVFENVVDNAVKYRKPDQPRARVQVSCGRDLDGGRRYVSVSLRDEGVGMDELRADQCFYKGRASGQNWGQGLYFAKYVIGLHAGKIRIGKEYTAPGIGTEVILHLPFVEEVIDV